MRRLPLRGADLVLVAMPTLCQAGRPSNNTLLVVECDGPIAPERVRQAVDRLLAFCPWPASRLRRGFPWGSLHWAAGPRAALEPPPVRHGAVASSAELQQALEAELNSAIDPRREAPLRLLTVDSGPGTRDAAPARGFLILTWFHPLMDPRGGQNLLMHLAHLDQNHGQAPWADAFPALIPAPDARPLRERGRLARRNRDYLRGLAPLPPVSPGTGLTTPGPARFRQESFINGEPDANGRRSTEEICWRLAMVGKAMAGLWRRRGLPDVPYLVPISVDLRRKGEPGATFGNQLAFHFARFKPSQTADVPALARALRQQMADAVRDGQIDASAVAMEFLKYRRVSKMLRVLPWTADGEMFSFACADTGNFPPALDSFFGRRVLNAYHAPTVPARPGIGVFFNRCGPTRNVVVSWVGGAVDEDDVTRIIDVIRDGAGPIKAK